MQPHRWQPTRLPRPWDSPGKSTGMGCHFLLQCMKSESEVTQPCPTLSDPMDCSLPGSSAHGIFQARVLEWGATAFSEELGLETDKAGPGLQPPALAATQGSIFFVITTKTLGLPRCRSGKESACQCWRCKT